MKDKCEVCKGHRGGVLGNENIIEGVIICDYCTAMLMAFDQAKRLRGVASECGTCGGRRRVLEDMNASARNPAKPDELVRVQQFVPCPDCTTRSPARMTEKEIRACKSGAGALEIAADQLDASGRPDCAERAKLRRAQAAILRRLAGDGGGT